MLFDIHSRHDDEDGKELQPDSPPHDFLAEIGASATHHGVQPEQQHQKNRNDRNCCGMIQDGFASRASVLNADLITLNEDLIEAGPVP
jgi:hypothetical protein